MSTLMKSRVIATSTNVIQLIPATLQTHAKSVQLIKDIAAIMLSAILANRKVVPDECFDTMYLGPEKVKILKTNSSDALAKGIARRVVALHDAINKGYLRELIICIKDEEETLETHTLLFEHSGLHYENVMVVKGAGKSKNEKRRFAIQHIAEEINQMYQSILSIMEQVNTIPKNPSCWLHVKFYDDVTPAGYQPEHFQMSNEKFKNLNSRSLNSGALGTPFHTLKLRSKFPPEITANIIINHGIDLDRTGLESIEAAMEKHASNAPSPQSVGSVHDEADLNNDLSDATRMNSTDSRAVALDSQEFVARAGRTELMTPSPNPNQLGYKQGSCIIEDTTEPINVADSNHNIALELASRPIKHFRFASQLVSEAIEVESSHSMPNVLIRCPCGVSIEFGIMLKCDICEAYQHVFCFDIFEEESVPDIHICELCHSEKYPCTVPELAGATQDQLKERCHLRLAIALCADPNLIITTHLLCETFNFDPDNAERLMQKLNSMKMFIHKPNGMTVNKRVYKRIIVPKYFPINFKSGRTTTLRHVRDASPPEATKKCKY